MKKYLIIFVGILSIILVFGFGIYNGVRAEDSCVNCTDCGSTCVMYSRCNPITVSNGGVCKSCSSSDTGTLCKSGGNKGRCINSSCDTGEIVCSPGWYNSCEAGRNAQGDSTILYCGSGGYCDVFIGSPAAPGRAYTGKCAASSAGGSYSCRTSGHVCSPANSASWYSSCGTCKTIDDTNSGGQTCKETDESSSGPTDGICVINNNSCNHGYAYSSAKGNTRYFSSCQAIADTDGNNAADSGSCVTDTGTSGSCRYASVIGGRAYYCNTTPAPPPSPPSPPQNLHSTSATTNSITWAWDQVTEATHYLLYPCSGANCNGEHAEQCTSYNGCDLDKDFDGNNLSADTNYEVAVSACNTDGCSTLSETAFARTLAEPETENTPPTSPEKQTPENSATGTEYSSITFSWEASTDPNPEDTITYKVYLTPANNPIWTSIVCTTEATTCEVTNLQSDTLYFWNVIACDDSECSHLPNQAP